MSNYTKRTGSSGYMKIVDTGTVVEFWLKAGSSTYNYNLPWGYTVNGTTENDQQYNFRSGGAWQKLGSWVVSTHQSVVFRLFASGTTGLGGPTTFTQEIVRGGTLPQAPTLPIISNVTASTADVTFYDRATGGTPIIERAIGYGTSPVGIQWLVLSDGSTTISFPVPGQLYYVWAKVKNSKGYSHWSARASFWAGAPPEPPGAPVVTSVSQTSMKVRLTPNGTSGKPVLAYQLGYGRDEVTPTYVVGCQAAHTITNLMPGTLYYLWAKVQTINGWSEWSERAEATTLAGAYVYSESGDIYRRIVGIGNFLSLSQTDRKWYGMAAAPNGDIYAADNGGDIYCRVSGMDDFIALSQTVRAWVGMAAAPNGNIYACVTGGDIYLRTGGVGNFVALGQTSRQWTYMTAAPNGDIYASVANGDIYRRAGGVGNFIALSQTSRAWVGMAAAPNGDVYACVNNGDIYLRTAGTGNFIALTQTTRAWVGMAAAPNGDVYAADNGGDIYCRAVGVGDFTALGQNASEWYAMTAAPNGDIYASVEGAWRPAVSLLRYNGVWRIARPWGYISGIWKPTA